MRKEPKRIESQQMLDKLLSKRSSDYPLGCFIMLNFGLKSSKEIWRNDRGDYWVYNDVDDSEVIIPHDKLMDCSFIGEAISKGALYRY